MKILELTTNINIDKRLNLQLPKTFEEGLYRVIIVLEKALPRSNQVEWGFSDYYFEDNATHRRSEIYGEDGR